MFNPLTTSERIGETFRRYILSTFSTSSDEYNEQLRKLLFEDDSIVRGPYLQISHNFPAGHSMGELIDQGVLSPEFRKLSDIGFMNRNLYGHQEQAILKAISGRNIVVSTGTGSGKTETFLIPILNELMREKEAGSLGPGVRAMLIYPMNALANDQLDNLRDVLIEYPDITFGSFTGETQDTKQEADDRDAGVVKHPPNEIYDRKSMRANPPNILISNYAMLEHLLLRPENCTLFGKPGNNSWRYIILDEAHTYTGAKGSEVTILLRRLKATLERSDIQFILTSATLGSEDQDKEVAEFASELCSTKFEESDIIRSTPIPLNYPTNPKKPEQGFYRSVAEIVAGSKMDPEKELSSLLSRCGYSSNNPRDVIYGILESDPDVHRLAAELEDNPLTVRELSNRIGIDESDVFSIIAAVSASRRHGSRLFNARYHFFIKGLDGAYVTLKGSDKLFIRPQRVYEDNNNNEFQVFQISTCYNCDAIFLLGQIDGGKLRQVSRSSEEYTGYEPFLLTRNQILDPGYLEDNPDSVYALCSRCGTISRGITPGCFCGPEFVEEVVKVSEKEKVCVCPMCGSKDSKRGLLRQLYLGTESSTAVIGSALFKDLLGSRDSRFLAFSDNRQSAAFFAPYMQNSYDNILMKRVIYETITRYRAEMESGVAMNKFIQMIKRVSDNCGGLLDDRQVVEAVVKECSQRSYRSLEHEGFLAFEYGNGWTPRDLPAFGLDKDEMYNLINTLIEYVRTRRAVDMNSTDFVPYKYRKGFSLENSKGLIKLCNKAVQAYLNAIVGSEKADKFADEFYKGFLDVTSSSGRFVKLENLNVRIPKKIYVCSKCRRTTSFNVDDRCIRCNTKTLEPRLVDIDALSLEDGMIATVPDPRDHYVRTVIDSPLQRFRIKEHTAQLDRNTARMYQNLFRDRKLDVLSCSTTFEMGVNIGSLNCVLMRNVPPSPASYIQRAGRAGRSEDASAYALTFCREMSHDVTFFQDPLKMINGRIEVPKIKPDNREIVIRHIFASAFGYYWRVQGETPCSANDLVNDYEGFKAYLESHPSDLAAYLMKVVPQSLQNTPDGFDLSEFGWISSLFGGNGIIGRMAETVKEYKTDSDILNEPIGMLQDSKKGHGNNKHRRALLRSAISSFGSLNTLENMNAVSFLSNNNLIPKYGFPTDVVSMVAASGSSTNDLSRSMRIAISEYAPGSEVVVDGKKVRSQYITPIRGGRWIQYKYWKCAGCKKITTRIDNYLSEKQSSNSDLVCSCGQSLSDVKRGSFIRPDMGFKYVDSKDFDFSSKPTHPHTTGVSFCDTYCPDESVVRLGCETLQLISKTNSRLIAVNESKYLVCERCGYAYTINEITKIKEKMSGHEKPNGVSCNNGHLNTVSLGSTFNTDVLIIHFISTPISDYSTALSILYALIEGLCRSFSIERNEIGGCLDNLNGSYSFIIYDDTPGGSGYVRSVSDSGSLRRIISAAERVVAECKCGGKNGDTSCYACLRNYNNQLFHDQLVRGKALEYFRSLRLEGEDE